MAQYTQPERHENADGSFTMIGAIPIEPPRADPQADRIKYADLLKAFGWADADYQEAVAATPSRGMHAFPKPVSFTQSGWITPRRQAVFSRSQVSAWLDRAKAFAAKLPKKSLV